MLAEDCVLIDGLMTNYSTHEYSQEDEFLQLPVERDGFKQDVLELIA
ncbi:TPA: hypothetical protein ACSTJX_005318 [Serratia fonticola]